MRFNAGFVAGFAVYFDASFALGFRGETAEFVAFLSACLVVLGVGVFVATFCNFLGSIKDFLNIAKKFGMFNTYGCARAHARCRNCIGIK